MQLIIEKNFSWSLVNFCVATRCVFIYLFFKYSKEQTKLKELKAYLYYK